MKKILTAVIMTAVLAASSATMVSAAEGIHSSWSEDYISEAEGLGIIPANINNDMTKNITRLEFCELVYNTINSIAKQNSIRITYNTRAAGFKDVNSQAVTALYRMGIVAGRSGTSFAPDDSITREEAAVVLDKTADYIGLVHFTNSNRFTDSRYISSWAYKSVNDVCGMNIMSGMGDGKFEPKGGYTVEQAISSMIRLKGAIPKESREKIDSNRYYLYNESYYWITDSNDNIIFMLSADRYKGVAFYSDGAEILAFAQVKDGNAYDVYSIESGKKLFDIKGSLCGTYANRSIIVSETVDVSTVYGVYDFTGRQLLPAEYQWDYLYSKGYVGTSQPW